MKIPLPPEWNYEGAIMPAGAPALDDALAALKEGLNHPIRHAGLREMGLSAKRIAVVVDDLTRPTPVSLLFPAVVEELVRAGARASEITVVLSLGTHRPMTEDEIAGRLGRVRTGAFKVVNHNCRDDSMLVSLGKTAGGTEVTVNRHLCEADLVVLVGTIEPHLLAGFGGGLKNVIPGCAGLATIASTHLRVEASRRYECAGKEGENCATRRDIEDGAKLLPVDYFLVNTVLTPDGEVAGIFCGDPVAAHRRGCALAARIYGAPLRKKADVLLLNSYPMDSDLRQATKCLANALPAARDDALLIGFLRCKHGAGDMVLPPRFRPLDETRRLARELGADGLVALREKAAGRSMDMDERYMNEFFGEMARRHLVLIYGPDLPPGVGELLGTFELFSDVDSLMARAGELKPSAETVISSPMGGVCYPILDPDGQ